MSTTDVSPSQSATPVIAEPGRKSAEPRRTVWMGVTGVLGGLMGLAPHVLHHVGPLVGTALVAGAGGTALFGLLGLAASVPMLVRLKRRFASWWAPVVALLVFAAMFGISSFVIGPRISAATDPAEPAVSETVDHGVHHDS
ncbi:hypothetical protein [Georgenia daeguensis]